VTLDDGSSWLSLSSSWVHILSTAANMSVTVRQPSITKATDKARLTHFFRQQRANSS
jgi:hypothetical protein